MKRSGDFGSDFLGHVLPACLFLSVDYVQALREHRRYLADMKPVFEKSDVLLTSGFGPAPRLDAHSHRELLATIECIHAVERRADTRARHVRRLSKDGLRSGCRSSAELATMRAC